MIKICIILGTRPEIIKMYPIIRACEKHSEDYFILYTGQHYSSEMDKAFFNDLEFPEPKYNLDVGSRTHATQTAKILISIEEILLKEKPDVVLVHWQPQNFTSKSVTLKPDSEVIREQCLEEINRIIADHISDYLFAPTETSRQNMLNEGMPDEMIFVTGNTVVDEAYQNLKLSKPHFNILEDLHLSPKHYFLVTTHGAENVDVAERLNGILTALHKNCNQTLTLRIASLRIQQGYEQ